MKIDWTLWLMLGTFALAVFLSLWYLLGSSPTDIQLIGGWLAFLSGWILKHEHQNFKQLTEMERRLHDKLIEIERKIIKTRCSWLIHALKCVVFTPLALSRVFECQRALKCGVLNPRTNIK